MLIKKNLADTGLEVSALGLGTVKFGRDQDVKYPYSFSIPDARQAAELLTLAKSLGINLIDTAPAYGNSEERLGTLLQGQRNDWVICSKVGEEFEHGHSRFDFTPEHTRYSVARSLRRLDTDFLDIVLVHSDGNDEDIILNRGTLETLAELKRAGLIRAFGMSTKTLSGGLLAALHCDCVMVTYNLEQRQERSIIDLCEKNNRGVLLKKALGSGHLLSENSLQDSMDFIFSHPGVTSAIVGTINPQHLRDNVARALLALQPR